MHRYKRLLILVAVLAAVCIATLALTNHKNRQDQIRASEKAVAQIPPEKILSFSWKNSDGSSFSFRKTDSGWKYQDEAFPVNEERLLDVLKSFENLTASFVIENVTDFSQYGVTNPKTTIQIETAERAYTFKMGGFSQMDEHRYMDMGDGKIYLIANDPASRVSSNLSILLMRDTLPSFTSVVDITFQGIENYTITRNNSAPEEGIYFTVRDSKTVPLDTGKVQQYLNTISTLDLLTDADYNATAEELPAYGLAAPLLTVTVNYTTPNADGTSAQEVCKLYIGENPEERAAADKAAAEGKTVIVTMYVRLDGSNIVYKLSDANYKALAACSYNDLRKQ